MSTTTRTTLAFRSSLRSASRRPVQVSLRRTPIGQRSYASLQHRVSQSSDLPWAIGAAAVTLPMLVLLWRSGPGQSKPPGHESSHGEGKDDGHVAEEEGSKVEDASGEGAEGDTHEAGAKDETGTSQTDEGKKDDEKPNESDSASSSGSSDGGDAPTPASSSENGEETKKEH